MHRAHTLSPPIGGEVGQGGLASCTWSVVACQGGFERHQHFLGSGMAGEVDHPVTHVGLDRSAGSPSALADHLIGILRNLSYLDSRHSASIALWHTRVPLADRAPPAGSPPGDLPVPSAVAPDRTHVSSKRRSDRSQRWGRPRSQCSTTSAVHPLEGCVPTNRSVRRSERRGGVAIGTSGCVTSLPIWVDVWLSRGSASLSHRRTRPLAPVSAVCPADRLSPSSSPPSPRTPTPPPDRPTARTASRRRSANMGTFRSPRPDRRTAPTSSAATHPWKAAYRRTARCPTARRNVGTPGLGRGGDDRVRDATVRRSRGPSCFHRPRHARVHRSTRFALGCAGGVRVAPEVVVHSVIPSFTPLVLHRRRWR